MELKRSRNTERALWDDCVFGIGLALESATSEGFEGGKGHKKGEAAF